MMVHRWLWALVWGGFGAAIGEGSARVDIWFYHLGAAQATAAIWAAPIVLGLGLALYGFIWADEDGEDAGG